MDVCHRVSTGGGAVVCPGVVCPKRVVCSGRCLPRGMFAKGGVCPEVSAGDGGSTRWGNKTTLCAIAFALRKL